MATPSPARRQVVTLLAVLPWALILFQFLLVLPRYDRLFREYGLHLPPTTQLLLDVSAWVNKFVFPAFLITFALMGVSVGVAHRAQTAAMSRARRTVVLLLVFGVPCGLFILAWVGMLATHRTLVEGLQR